MIGLSLVLPASTSAFFFYADCNQLVGIVNKYDTVIDWQCLTLRNPIIAITLTAIPDIHNARRPPVNASGTVNITMNGERRDWNCTCTMTRIHKYDCQRQHLKEFHHRLVDGPHPLQSSLSRSLPAR